MKEDMIYRQNAIDVICLSWCGCQNSDCKHHFDPEVDESYWCDGCGDVEELKNIPSAQPERKAGGWIPCSERLPERHQKVLLTIYGTDVIRMKQGESFKDAFARIRKNVRVSVGYRSEERWYGADGYPMIVAPIAWMPMPDPYREEGYD